MWYNPFLSMILHSPLHSLLSGNLLALTYTGRKSGRTYTTPVNYVRDGDHLWVTSYRTRTWWHNLCGGVPVSLQLQGRRVQATGEVLEDEVAVAEALSVYLSQVPGWAKYFKVGLKANGQPDHNDLARAAKERVMIQFRLR